MIGVNTFCLREEIADHAAEIIKQLHEMGYTTVEPFTSSVEDLAAIKAETDKWGMTIPSVHPNFGGSSIAPRAEDMLPFLRQLHGLFGVDTFVISGLFTDAEGAESWGLFSKALADSLKEEGCRIVYHNHDYEVREICVDGKMVSGLDHFFRFAGPDVLLQLDIGWAGMGGDEVEIAKHYQDRIYALHLKDFHPGYRGKYECRTIPHDSFCAIGEGEIRHGEVIAMRHEMPNFCGSIIVDQDCSSTDLMADLAIGLKNTLRWLHE